MGVFKEKLLRKEIPNMGVQECRQREYKSWSAMKNRCYVETCDDFKRYGARGIRVCDSWIYSFETFLKDMGNKPSKEYSIDRIDNNGNYEPTNCKWATKKEQNHNTRKNVWMEYMGETLVQADWARKLNLDVRIFNYHLRKMSLSEIIDMVQSGGMIDKRRKPYNKIYYPKREVINAIKELI